MKFAVEFSTYWVEYGTAKIEADSEADAREIADTMLASDEDAIKWTNQEPTGERRVDSITEVI